MEEVWEETLLIPPPDGVPIWGQMKESGECRSFILTKSGEPLIEGEIVALFLGEATGGESPPPDPSGEQQALAAWHLVHISHQVSSPWRTWFQKPPTDASIDVVTGGADQANSLHACVDGRSCFDLDLFKTWTLKLYDGQSLCTTLSGTQVWLARSC